MGIGCSSKGSCSGKGCGSCSGKGCGSRGWRGVVVEGEVACCIFGLEGVGMVVSMLVGN